ncbi:MAG: PBP1A family penicillin-binding protein [Pseudomonadales bacterium]|nr:PBP1A family penicillin-binding protein [Pseudomonadales bacterium]
MNIQPGMVKPQKKSKHSLLKRLGKYALWLSLVASLSLLLGLFLILPSDLPKAERITDIQLQTPLRILSEDGKLIAEYGEKRRIPVLFEDVPGAQVQAFLAAEDSRFYNHHGVDFKGLARGVVQLLTTGRIRSGGSTITMQVAKNYFLSPERTLKRKLTEIFLALQIEQELTKTEILELYFNKIYLGHRAYGIAAAAQVYYGKSISALTLAEQAMLAGLPKAPSKYNPLSDPERALIRRNWILDRMALLGYISAEEIRLAKEQPITAQYHGQRSELDAPYVADMAREEMLARYGKRTYTDGYEITVTVNSELQRAATSALRKGLEAYDKRHGVSGAESKTDPDKAVPEVQGALVSLDVHSGAIRALQGGYDFQRSKFNRATKARRQPGSTFKPFIYLAGLEKGLTAASRMNDAPVVFDNGTGGWRPQNSGGRYKGAIPLRQALYESRNMVSIRLLDHIGLSYAEEFLGRFGFDVSAQDRNLALALGSAALTPLQVVKGYGMLANGGYDLEPYLIEQVKQNGRLIYQRADTPRSEPVVDPRSVFILQSMLKDVIQKGTGRRARVLGRQDLAGKTGTTNDQHDAWFSGFNGNLATSVWVGFDEPKTLGKYEFGGRAALPVWIDYMGRALQNETEFDMPMPEGVVTSRISQETGLPTLDLSNSYFEFFRAEHAPRLDQIVNSKRVNDLEEMMLF